VGRVAVPIIVAVLIVATVACVFGVATRWPAFASPPRR
jgi:hypothetical protein